MAQDNLPGAKALINEMLLALKPPEIICGFSTYTPSSTTFRVNISYRFKVKGTVVLQETAPTSYNGTNKLAKYELKPKQYFRRDKGSLMAVMQFVDGAQTFNGSKFN